MHNIARVAASLRLVTLDKGLVKKWWRCNRAACCWPVSRPSAGKLLIVLRPRRCGVILAAASHAPGHPVAGFTIRLVGRGNGGALKSVGYRSILAARGGPGLTAKTRPLHPPQSPLPSRAFAPLRLGQFISDRKMAWRCKASPLVQATSPPPPPPRRPGPTALIRNASKTNIGCSKEHLHRNS